MSRKIVACFFFLHTVPLGAPKGPVFTSRKQKSCQQSWAEGHTGNRTETCNATLSF